MRRRGKFDCSYEFDLDTGEVIEQDNGSGFECYKGLSNVVKSVANVATGGIYGTVVGAKNGGLKGAITGAVDGTITGGALQASGLYNPKRRRGASSSFNNSNKDAYEAKLFDRQSRSLDNQTRIASNQENRSADQYNLWKKNYQGMETNNLKNAVLDANKNMGKADMGTLARSKASNYANIDSGYAQGERDLSASLARRGIGNSGIAARGYGDLAMNKANNMAQAGANSYNQAVQAGDTYRQQKVANLTGFAQLGRGMQGASQNYLSQAGGLYGQNAQIAGSTALGLGNQAVQLQSAQMNAQAQKDAGKGAMVGGAMGMGSAAMMMSDERLKENIEYVGEFYGYSFYTWDWNEKGLEIADPNQPTFGVMAQEVKRINPKAVVMEDDGYYRVDYNLIMGGSL